VASAVFGRFVSDAGIAFSIGKTIAGAAKRSEKHQILLACLTLPAINAILTYSGVSLFVAVFTLMFIGRDLFKELDIPWHLYGFGIFGSATFTMGMLPGSPQIQNLLPMKYFGTDPMAAPLLGIIMAVLNIILGVIYCKYAVNKAIKNNEHYLDLGQGIEDYIASTGAGGQMTDRQVQPLWKCLVPLVTPLIVMNVFKQDPVYALLVATVITYILFRNEFGNVKKSLNEGSVNAFTPMFSICAAVGFGGAVSVLPGFKMIMAALVAMPGPATLHMVVGIAVAAGITGSSSAGTMIGLDALAKHYAPLMDSAVAHRLAASSGFMALLPHNGGVFSTVTIIRVKHKDIYRHYFMLGLLIPGIVVFVGVFLAQLGIK
jgi:H+/gluconate symporter-like permease